MTQITVINDNITTEPHCLKYKNKKLNTKLTYEY